MFLTSFFIYSCSIFSILASQSDEQMLININGDFDLNSIMTSDAKVMLSSDGNSLRIDTGHEAAWPGITIKNPEDNRNLSSFKYIALDVKNIGSKSVTVNWRIDNPGADGNKNCITTSINIKPNEQKTLKVSLPRVLPDWLAPKMFGMRGYPGGLIKETTLDIGNITQFVIFVNQSSNDYSFEIGNIRAWGKYTPPEWLSMSENEFFPMIDEYGQFIHKDWAGKTHSKDDLTKHKQEEQTDLEKHSSPENWDIYGGWKDGIQLEATGYFRVEKYDGKWWLVDPEGHLFWSHGIDCVGDWNGVTPITDREFYFKDLPDKDSPFSNFYGEASWAPHNYYENKGTYKTYNFTSSNLLRKYGENWREQFADITQNRLRSWGMNTIGNWSSDFIYNKRKTPYVVSIGFGGKLLEGSEGYWGKFRDVFDDGFEAEVKKSMAWQKDKSANDSWCLGYFVDNEISWGDEVSLSIAALVSPAEQPAKKVFIDDLKAKYDTIDKLNQIWETNYESWDAMYQNREAPDRKKAYEDLTAFYAKFAERYFKVCREAVKDIAPNNLYLGCRFAWANDLAVKASAKYCDVISYNFYYKDIEDVRLPADIDMPVIVGEFHFGALDRGMFHTGLQATDNQDDRANTYKNYVTGALKNPQIVGTHWFQYSDQATTGRGDGENYQIGFVDIVDTPYSETINACREVGYNMYKIRAKREYQMFYKPKALETGNMWDTWLYYHEGNYYLYYLANSGTEWNNISMATSIDGVHWKELGRILAKGDGVTWMGTGSTWKSPNFKTDGKFQINFSEWKGPRQTIFFAESKDLVHWTRLGDEYEFRQDERWYEPNGRWDCIWTIPRSDGGLYGYWTATPKPETEGQFGFGETLDGVNWKALPPPKVYGVGEGEVGAIEKMGDKYYMMFGSGGMMVTLVADNPEGPFHAVKKNFRLLSGHTYFSRFFPMPDGVLVNHHSIARDGQVYFGLLKQTIFDDEGTLRLGWWSGNEKLKHEIIDMKLPNQKADNSIIMLENTFDTDQGLILEGNMTIPQETNLAPNGIYVEFGDSQGTAILVSFNGVTELGTMQSDGSGFILEKRVDRETSFGKTADFRLLLKQSLLEFYLNDILIECFSLPAKATGRIGLIQGNAHNAIYDLQAWR